MFVLCHLQTLNLGLKITVKTMSINFPVTLNYDLKIDVCIQLVWCQLKRLRCGLQITIERTCI